MPTTTPPLARASAKMARLAKEMKSLEKLVARKTNELKRAHRRYGFSTTAEFIEALQSFADKPAKVTRKKGNTTRRLSPAKRKELDAAIKAGATPPELIARFKIAPATAAYHIGRAAAKKAKPAVTNKAKPAVKS